MSIASDPLVTNFLNPSGFEVVFRRLPFTTFYCQEVSLPDVNLPVITTGTPFIKMNFSSTEIDIGRFVMTFKVDENLKNYNELLNWIKGLGFPEDFKQYRDNKASHAREAIRSDASVFILTSSKNPNREVTLIDCIPVAITPLKFTTLDQENISWISCTAVFSVRDFTVTTINECDPDG